MPDGALIGSYDHRLVGLSVLLAVLASYAALSLAARIAASAGGIRSVWLVAGAGAMGLGSGPCTTSECSPTDSP